jgi:outer membrane protein OmpA-like peptidoglycan-associated protein
MNIVRACAFISLLAAASASVAQPADSSRMIFFDWGKSELTRDATTTLDRLAAEFLASGKQVMTLQSHSDRSGSRAVNLRMSRKRADIVADYLRSRGVAPQAIKIEAKGEDDLLVDTQDGVREVQNRRIDIQF